MTRIRTWALANRLAAIAIMIAALLTGAATAVAVAQATDQPGFCQSACHEMQPYGAAWSLGPHKGIGCVECHVEPGMVARLAHKKEATKELWVHLSGDPTFPLAKPPEVPDDRCLRCHESIKTPGFDHAAHQRGRACQGCHSDVGHEVRPAALQAAGVLNLRSITATAPVRFAIVDGGRANIEGHPATPCQRCHDMAATGCGSCHTAKHDTGKARKDAECSNCHNANGDFAFAHPAGKIDCAGCHNPPATDHDFKGACSGCHRRQGASWDFTHDTGIANCADCHEPPAKHRAGRCESCHKPGSSWKFTHPSASSQCTGCHQRPAGHRSGSCTNCHRTGKSWAFNHPSGRSCTGCHQRPAGHRTGSCTNCHRAGQSWAFRHPNGGCASCHKRPSGHKSGSCTKCHRAGKSWAFRHPGSGCTSCHKRPSGHKSGSCTKCHRAGKSWAFRHPSGGCASCHKAPGNHYGSSCSSCHSPSRKWSSARFSHPRIPGGEHSYRSFSCGKCHPGGYSSYTCKACHDSSTGPKEGDDDDD